MFSFSGITTVRTNLLSWVFHYVLRFISADSTLVITVVETNLSMFSLHLLSRDMLEWNGAY